MTMLQVPVTAELLPDEESYLINLPEHIPDAPFELKIVAVFCPSKPGTYQIRHIRWGVFQGVVQGRCAWHLTSKSAGMLIAKFYTKQEATEAFLLLASPYSDLHGTGYASHIVIEAYDIALERSLWERGQPEILAGTVPE